MWALRDNLKKRDEEPMQAVEKCNILVGTLRSKEEEFELNRCVEANAMIIKPKWTSCKANLKNASSRRRLSRERLPRRRRSSRRWSPLGWTLGGMWISSSWRTRLFGMREKMISRRQGLRRIGSRRGSESWTGKTPTFMTEFPLWSLRGPKYLHDLLHPMLLFSPTSLGSCMNSGSMFKTN